jgi:TonB family protein
VLHAVGAQIYTCVPGADGKYAWTLKAPQAELRDAQGAEVGRHYAGPTWKYKDGSEVVGKAAAKVDSPDAGAIPWLLVSVVSHSGEGVLSQVISIQRVHTKGGQPAAAQECSAARQNAETSSSYEADYYFYAPGKDTSDISVPSQTAGAGSRVLGGVLTSNTGPTPKAGMSAPQRIRVSQGVLQGLLVSKVNPEYPAEAKDRHVEGDVLLKVNIDKEGNVYKVEPESGDPQLTAAAADAVKQWKYRPFLLNGQAVEVESKVKVDFSLAP